MIVVLATLGTRSAMLVGFCDPHILPAVLHPAGRHGPCPISNIVMFGLILAVGMLVDGAIVVVEYADKRLNEGARPMQAYTDAAKRMFWPIRVLDRHDALRLPADAVLARRGGRVHGDAARDADLPSLRRRLSWR